MGSALVQKRTLKVKLSSANEQGRRGEGALQIDGSLQSYTHKKFVLFIPCACLLSAEATLPYFVVNAVGLWAVMHTVW